VRAVGSRIAAAHRVPLRFWVPPAAAPIASADHVTHHHVKSGTASIGTLLWPSRLDRFEPDDIFHATVNVLGFGLPCRTILTLHDVIWLEHPAWCQPNPFLLPFSERYFSIGIRHGIAAADRIITVSHAAADSILRVAPQVRSRLSVVPLAADPAFREPVSRDAAHVIGSEQPYFLVVGQNQASKGHSYALQAFAAARPKGQRLVFVQRLRQGHGLHREAAELGIAEHVSFVGAQPREELIALIQAATALLQPSLAEGFGLPVLEAMACGCPVIASDIPPLREVLGGAGILAAPASASELTGALQRMAAEPSLRSELRQRGLERAPNFSWERTAEQTWDVYEELAAR
jgi:glycosyltransferase involved in cell wall biosynthesis